jgi:hypothetical protein
MRREPDPPISRYEHGYECEAARRDCPRCADRAVAVLPAVGRLRRTRWYATDTTLGPFAKVAIHNARPTRHEPATNLS